MLLTTVPPVFPAQDKGMAAGTEEGTSGMAVQVERWKDNHST